MAYRFVLVVRSLLPWLLLFSGSAARGAAWTPVLPLDSPAIIGSSEAFSSGAWKPANLVDGDLHTEYASASKGVGTHVDFDFGKPVLVAGFKHIDRKDPATVKSAKLLFSSQPDFRSPITTVPVQHANEAGGTTLVTFPGVTARYVRWEVTAINSAGHRAVGGAEIAFFTSAASDPAPTRDLPYRRARPAHLPEGWPAIAAGDHHGGSPLRRDGTALLELDGMAPIPLELRLGKQSQEITLPAVQAETPLQAMLKVSGQVGGASANRPSCRCGRGLSICCPIRTTTSAIRRCNPMWSASRSTISRRRCGWPARRPAIPRASLQVERRGDVAGGLLPAPGNGGRERIAAPGDPLRPGRPRGAVWEHAHRAFPA